MSMKYVSTLTILLVMTSGCTNPAVETKVDVASIKSEDQLPKRVERYEEVRARLLQEGWKPMPAKCSADNLCGEYVELSTNMETVVSCGSFKKGDQTATVCGESIPDALLVTSIKIEPAE